MKPNAHYQNPALCRSLADRIAEMAKGQIRIMEVCGTHTVSIFRHGIRFLLPESILLVSGPGCPVCVTDQRDIDAFIKLAGQDNTIIHTFGDLMRVPGSSSSLQKEKAEGRDIRIVYSATDAIDTAMVNPTKQVVFAGVGFETTAPTIAASVVAAKRMGIDNYSIYCTHKRVPPALDALASDRDMHIDGFLLPGHVSVIIGRKGYEPFFQKYRIPSAIAGFEPVDILVAILRLVEMITEGSPALINAYPRAVPENGNATARKTMETVFDTCDARWRGLGLIPGSGLAFRDEYAHFDAQRRFGITFPETCLPSGCLCGEILTGKITPPQCPLYNKACTPIDPVGPCMVSSEGTCAAYYNYAAGDDG